jgi:hypothetical protein
MRLTIGTLLLLSAAFYNSLVPAVLGHFVGVAAFERG